MKKIIFSICAFFLCISYVIADDYTYGGQVDISDKVNYTIVDNTSQNGAKELHIRFTGMSNIVSGVNFNSIEVNMEGYYTCAGEGSNMISPPHAFDDRTHLEYDMDLTKIDNDTWDLHVSSLWLFAEGYNTFKFGFFTNNTCYKSNTINIDKTTYTNTKLPPLDERYSLTVGLNPNGTTTIYQVGTEVPVEKGLQIKSNYPFSDDELEIKYGLIKDLLILDDLKNNVAGVNERLIEYAKNDNKGITFSQIVIGNSIVVYNYSDVDIEKNAIYYFYVKYKNRAKNTYNYTGTDGIIIAQGSDKDTPTILTTVDYSKASNATLTATDPTSEDNSDDTTTTGTTTDENKPEETTKEKEKTGTTDNPKTGLSISILLIGTLLIIGVCIYKYSRKKIFRI